MLLLLIHNDGTGKDGLANYDIEVRINAVIISTLRVEGHKRSDGWVKLVKKIVKEAEKKK